MINHPKESSWVKT